MVDVVVEEERLDARLLELWRVVVDTAGASPGPGASPCKFVVLIYGLCWYSGLWCLVVVILWLFSFMGLLSE